LEIAIEFLLVLFFLTYLFEHKMSTKLSKVPVIFGDSGDKQLGALKASLTEQAREAYDGFKATEKSSLPNLKRALRTS
jgi:hypothetical protein